MESRSLLLGSIAVCCVMLWPTILAGQVRVAPLGAQPIVHQPVSRNAQDIPLFSFIDSTAPTHQRHVVRDMLIGGAIGAVIGEGVAAYQVSRASSRNQLSSYAYIAGPIVGGIIGAIIGALAGT